MEYEIKITFTPGSEFQEQVFKTTIDAFLKALSDQFKQTHKKNKLDYEVISSVSLEDQMKFSKEIKS